jgi:hypothetical protein
VRSHYFAAPQLLTELSLQAAGAPPLPALPLPRGDLLIDVDTRHCEACDEFADPQASRGAAVWLQPSSDGEPGGRLGVDVTLPRGLWRVFARIRPGTEAEASVTLSIDGPNAASHDFGQTWTHFPHDAWVWSSLQPGQPPLQLKVRNRSKYQLVFEANEGPVSLDQVWFSKQQRELPTQSNPLQR